MTAKKVAVQPHHTKKPAAKKAAARPTPRATSQLTYSANVVGKRRLSDAKVKSMVRAMLEPA